MRPADGQQVMLTVQLRVPAFWSDDLNRWVLDRERTLDTFGRDSSAIVAVHPKDEMEAAL